MDNRGGHEWYASIDNFQGLGFTTKQRQVYTVVEGEAYVITFTAGSANYDTYTGIFNDALDREGLQYSSFF